MAAFTTTSPASGLVIKTLILVAVVAIGALAGSYLMQDSASGADVDDVVGVQSAPVQPSPAKVVDRLSPPPAMASGKHAKTIS